MLYIKKGGSPREGGPNVLADWRLADFFLGSWRLFFSSLFSASVFHGFSVDFGRVLETNMRPKINFWRGFWDAFLAPSFCSLFLMHFDGFFKAQFLENSDFT